MRVSWPGGTVLLPVVRGNTKWQLVAGGSTMRLRYRTTKWVVWGPVLPRQVTVTATHQVLRVYRAAGTATDYRESLIATRSGATVVTVNRLHLDTYLRGVVPRESPSYWPQQALRAQAVAARTYAYASVRSPRSSLYDICDTTACQVYGGAARYYARGTPQYGAPAPTPPARDPPPGGIQTPAGRVATAEYSASNGGWIAYGGKSYLLPKRDPYTAADPNASWSFKVNVVALGKKFGLARLDTLQVLRRDGQGAGGGRLTQARLTGIDGAGKPRAVVVTGSQLKNALGAKSNYLRLRVG